MTVDPSIVPFSCAGARIACSASPHGDLLLKDVGPGDECNTHVFTVNIPGATPGDGRWTASSMACWYGNRTVVMRFVRRDCLFVDARHASVRFTMINERYDHVQIHDSLSVSVRCYRTDRVYHFTAHEGSLRVRAPWKEVGHEEIVIEVTDGTVFIREYDVIPNEENEAHGETVGGHRAIWADWHDWCRRLPPVPKTWRPVRDLAAYITWSCVVGPDGRLGRPAMYMSKNWMNNIWSWDNCFNAMAIASRRPRVALDQLELFADYQHASGAYPDFINTAGLSFSCVKPPIHGWALRNVCERMGQVAHDEIHHLYRSICRSTDYWLQFRRLDSGALAYYHGNDSGWDNATVFSHGGPVESPDLYAHLARQCDELGDVASLLGLHDDVERHRSVAVELVDLMMDRLWDGTQFIARRGNNGDPVEERDSLLLRMPIVVHKRLPETVSRTLMEDLINEERFLAPFGLATEALDSPLYRPNGYWRGPVWAPIVYLVISALEEMEYPCAEEIASRFLRAVDRSGMAENFDPVTGEGLSDPAFTWTSSVVLLLLERYGNKLPDMDRG